MIFTGACKKTFSKVLTLAEYEKGKITCPHRGSKRGGAELVSVLRHHL